MTDLRAPLFARSLLLQAGFSDERRQGLGFAWAVDPALAVAYSRSADGFRAARLRHLGSFNTHPCASGLILGACAELEARAGAGEAPAAARAAALKAALGAALAGAADAFFWGALRPLAAAAAVLAALAAARLGAAHPLAIGAAAGLAVFNGPALFARWRGVALGLRGGEESALVAARLPVQRWLRAARLAAALLVFAAVVGALGQPRFSGSTVLAAGALALGAILCDAAGGPLRLAAAVGLVGAAASIATGWTP